MKRFNLIAIILFCTLSLNLHAQKLFPAEEKNKFGFIDVNGNWVIPPSFTGVDIFCEGLARVVLNDRWGYVNEKGEMATPIIYEDAKNFSGGVGRAKVKVNPADSHGVYGLIDKKGNWILKPSLSKIEPFDEAGVALAKAEGGNWGFIDRSGNWVIQPIFDGLEEFGDDLAMAKSKGNWGFIDRKGDWVIQPKYDHILSFSNGRAFVEYGGKWLLIDKNGKQIGNNVFSAVKTFSSGVGRVKESRWGIIDTLGMWIVQPKYENLEPFVDGLARAKYQGFWGAIDTQGQWIIKPELEGLEDFKDGLAQAKRNFKWGYVNKSGTWVIDAKFDHAYEFIDGNAVVQVNGEWGIIDKSGQYTAQPKFDRVKSLKEDKAMSFKF